MDPEQDPATTVIDPATPPEDAEDPTKNQEDPAGDADDVDEDDPESPEYWQNKAKKNGSEARNLRQRLREAEKAAAEAQKKLAPLEAAAKAAREKDATDLDTANTRIKDLLEENNTLRRATWLAAVDARWDLPARAKDFITGDNAEEFLQSADEIAADLGLERKDKAPRRTKTAAVELNGGRNAGKEPALTVDQALAKAVEDKDFRKAAQLKASKLSVLMHQG